MSAESRAVAARREHHADFARLFAELRVEDPIPPVDLWWSAMAPNTTFLELDGRVVAYGYAQALSKTGYVRHVVTAPEVRGRGLGRELMYVLARWLRERGCERWELNVKVENTVAIALYHSLGMEDVYRTRVVRIPRTVAADWPPPSRPIPITSVPPELDAALEHHFALATGLLASLRAFAGHRLLLAGTPEEPLGAARFDPAYPGCFPFCAASFEVAGAMVQSMLPDLAPDKTWIQLVIDRDRALVDALLAAGGALKMELLHLEGALP